MGLKRSNYEIAFVFISIIRLFRPSVCFQGSPARCFSAAGRVEDLQLAVRWVIVVP